MAVTGIAGVVLAMHGWSARASAVTPGIASSSGPVAAPGPASPRATASSPAQAPSSAAASPAASPTAQGQAGAGPLLSTEPYASSAFLIWPGQPDATARQALTGLTVKVRKLATGLSVTAGVAGQPAAASHVYATGARVYIIEASMGDDSGNSDYSLGDDGLVITDSRGRVLK